MTKVFDCIEAGTQTDSGIPVSGHQYVSELAIYDKDTGRMYAVLKCSHCSRHSVSWSESNDNHDGRYGFTYAVGGSE